MGVSVDQAWHSDHAICLNDLASATGFNASAWLNSADAVTFDGNVVVTQNTYLTLTGDLQNVGVVNQQVKHRCTSLRLMHIILAQLITFWRGTEMSRYTVWLSY
jgi:hypothetical protein